MSGRSGYYRFGYMATLHVPMGMTPFTRVRDSNSQENARKNANEPKNIRRLLIISIISSFCEATSPEHAERRRNARDVTHCTTHHRLHVGLSNYTRIHKNILF